MKKIKSIVLGGLAVGALIAMSGCSNEAPSTHSEIPADQPIIIGAAVAKSGWGIDYDMPPLNALKVKIAEINDQGGVDGRLIELIEEDTQTEIERGATAAQTLIQKGAEIMVSTCDFDFGGPAATVGQQNGLLSLSLCASSPKFGVQGIGDLAFTPRGSIATESAVLSDFAMEKDFVRIAMIIDESSAAASGLCSAFESYFPEAGGEIVSKSSYEPTDTSFSSQVEAVRSSSADAVLLCGIPPTGASVLRQLRTSGIDLPILAGDPFEGSYWTESVPGVSNVFAVTAASTFGDSQVSGANELFGTIEELYGERPVRGDAIYGYVLGEMIAAAIEGSNGSTEGKTLAQFLESNTVQTILGDYSYDPETHISLNQPWEIIEFTDGIPKPIGVFAPQIEILITDGI